MVQTSNVRPVVQVSEVVLKLIVVGFRSRMSDLDSQKLSAYLIPALLSGVTFGVVSGITGASNGIVTVVTVGLITGVGNAFVKGFFDLRVTQLNHEFQKQEKLQEQERLNQEKLNKEYDRVLSDLLKLSKPDRIKKLPCTPDDLRQIQAVVPGMSAFKIVPKDEKVKIYDEVEPDLFLFLEEYPDKEYTVFKETKDIFDKWFSKESSSYELFQLPSISVANEKIFKLVDKISGLRRNDPRIK